MSNDDHLLLETSEANLVAGMKYLVLAGYLRHYFFNSRMEK